MKKIKYFLRLFFIFGITLFLNACSSEKCTPYHKMLGYDTSDCSLCPILRVVFNTVSKVAATASTMFSSPVVTVVLVAFAVWLAVYILQYLSSMETRDAKDVFQEILIKGCQVILVVCALNYGATNFYKWLINPVYETALTGAQEAFNSCIGEDGQKCNQQRSSRIKMNSKASVREIANGLPASMGNSIIKTMLIMENNVSEVRAFGSSLMCYSWDRRVLVIIPRFNLLFSGLFFWAMAIAMIVIVPFLLVDVIFELAVAVALLPPAIGCYPFRVTRQYSKKVWETFLNSAFSFLFVSMVVIMIITVLKITAMDIASGTGYTWSQIMSDQKGLVDSYIDKFGWFQGRMLKMVFVFVLAWAVMNMGREFADEFASSISSTTIGGSIGTMAASAIKGGGQKLFSPLGQHIGNSMMRGAGRFGAIANEKIQTRREARRQKRFERGFKRHNGQRITDAEGNTSATYTRNRKFLGMGFGGLFGKKTYTQDADGNISVEKTRGPIGRGVQRVGQGIKNVREKIRNVFRKAEQVVSTPQVHNLRISTRTDRITNENFETVRKVRIKTGYTVDEATGLRHEFREEQTISESVIVRKQAAEKVMKADGTLDEEKVAKMMENLSEKQKAEFKQQLARKIAMDTFGDYNKESAKSISTRIEGDKVITEVLHSNGEKVITEMTFPQRREIVLGGQMEGQSADLDRVLGTAYVEYKNMRGENLYHGYHTTDDYKEFSKKLLNGELLTEENGRYADFKDFRDEAIKTQEEAKQETKPYTGRVLMERVIIKKNGKAMKLSSDGLYNRMDEFRVFDEDKSMVGRGAKRLLRVVPIYHGINNLHHKDDILQMHSISDVENRAVRYSGGHIKSKSQWQQGKYYYKGCEDESLVLPQTSKVNRFIHFTNPITGKEVGTKAHINNRGEFVEDIRDENGNPVINPETGQPETRSIAQNVTFKDKDGKDLQVYVTSTGRRYTIQDCVMRNKDGSEMKDEKGEIMTFKCQAFVGEDGKIEWGHEIKDEPKRKLMTWTMPNGETREVIHNTKDNTLMGATEGDYTNIYGFVEAMPKDKLSTDPRFSYYFS